ncbi:excinuclease ABC subunit UvrB [Desulfosudis oleivorans]|uniref:UvrABC system protein B n=1 Tax=Desulfosudis oleivorans (strain DSM 6200 / JCM 39069 / Hxd3) TaxID=96561 RepID=A8ZVJ3_DESOH|nr:excinuclease ABC subunit UvrB [Desulfosudis oleivorans]ABW68180.1 excinuclease ABC, B subunit [Desulfosudis oleivorans Hxd3]
MYDLTTSFTPAGDQPRAIRRLCDQIRSGRRHNVFVGVTGSGKTFTMAHVIAELKRPALIIAPNKTLAAQLYNEFHALFPRNAVEYFVSYYDFYQPEAYLPVTDTYIQKDSSINDTIDKMRHSATRSVLSRPDVIVVASVSCIFGLGSPEDYRGLRVELAPGMELDRDRLLADLVAIQYERNDYDFSRGVFRVRGDRVDIFPASEEEAALRVEFFGDEVEALFEIDPLKGSVRGKIPRAVIYPATHYVTRQQDRKAIVDRVNEELKVRIDHFRAAGKLIEAQRIEERTRFDLEMILEMGYCNGIENYSRHLTGREPGQPPATLLDYFPDDFLLFLDECHITVPQLGAMYKGDHSRKSTLVEFGFRLPSALDNRPLTFEEFEEKTGRAAVIYVSATPAAYEYRKAGDAVAEQIVRPTGLVDPRIEVRSAENQVDHLFDEIRARVEKNERVLITTLTKRMAEDLTDYYAELGVKTRYLHSEVKTLERMAVISELRRGDVDVLIGINLLREGLDIPEVSLVAVLDADKEGFLRSERSLIQIFGRAARNVNGTVILYADRITDAMARAMDETNRRRKIQATYNTDHHITPRTIFKEMSPDFGAQGGDRAGPSAAVAETLARYGDTDDLDEIIRRLEKEMKAAADDYEFEKAADIRDRIAALRKLIVFDGNG